MSDFTTRLNAAVAKRTNLDATLKKAEGRLEAAKQSLATVEAECRTKGVEPDKIDETILRLETKAETLLTQFESELAAAEIAIQPYIKEN